MFINEKKVSSSWGEDWISWEENSSVTLVLTLTALLLLVDLMSYVTLCDNFLCIALVVTGVNNICMETVLWNKIKPCVAAVCNIPFIWRALGFSMCLLTKPYAALRVRNVKYSFFGSQTKNKSKDDNVLRNLLLKPLKFFVFDNLTIFLIYDLLFIFLKNWMQVISSL